MAQRTLLISLCSLLLCGPALADASKDLKKIASTLAGVKGFFQNLITNLSAILEGINFSRIGLRFADFVIDGIAAALETISNSFGRLVNSLLDAIQNLPGLRGNVQFGRLSGISLGTSR